MTTWSTDAYHRRGWAVNLDQFAAATESVVVGGPAHGCRAIDLRVAGGIDLRLLPDRGLDVGAAWFAGVPLAWCSAVGESAPLDDPRDTAWVGRFGGGLVTTCGLRNVGAPSEGHGQHGNYSHLRARDVRVERTIGPEGGARLTVSATVDEVSALGPHLRVERVLTTRSDAGGVELIDTTTNLGAGPEPAPLLYHVNVGAPLWGPGGRLELDSADVRPRDHDAEAGLRGWGEPPEPAPAASEQVFEHRVRARNGDWAVATVRNPEVGLAVEVSWDTRTLPRLHQWRHPGLGVLGIEPANCSVLGRAADREAGTLPVLDPGERRRTRLAIRVGPA